MKKTSKKTPTENQSKEVHKRKKPGFLLLIICLVLIYGIYGTIGPYIGNRTLNPLWQNRFSTTGFYNNSGLYGPDRIRLLDNYHASNMACLNAIDSANEHLLICLDDLATNDTNTLFTGAILAAAKRGVAVEIILDGSVQAENNTCVQALATDELISFSEYRSIQPLLPWTYHSRMNDCFLVADDRLAWYSEGQHFSNLKPDQWDVLIYNSLTDSRQTALSIISELKNYHISLWNSTQTVRLTNDKLYDEAAKSTAENALNTWQSTRSEHPELQSEKSNYQTETAATDNITLIKNPVNDANKEPYVWFQLSRLMNGQNGSRSDTTIGLSPDMLSDIEKIMGSVEKVQLITQTPDANGAYCKRADYRYNRSSVINTGLQIYEIQTAKPHGAKALLIDNGLTAVGSYKWDLSSTYTNTASALVIQSDDLNHEIKVKSQEIIDQSLLVKPDGQYSQSDNVKQLESSKWHQIAQLVVGFFLQFFRTLI